MGLVEIFVIAAMNSTMPTPKQPGMSLSSSFWTVLMCYAAQKGGLVIRESLNANSKHFSLYASGSMGLFN